MRLDEEVGGADLVGAGDRGVVVEAGQHQHRQRFEAGQVAQLAAGLEAVEARASSASSTTTSGMPVGQQLRMRPRRCVASVIVEAALAQRDADGQQVDLVVVDEQHRRLFGQEVDVRCCGQTSRATPRICFSVCSTAVVSGSMQSIRSARPSRVSSRIMDSISHTVATT